MKPAFNIHYWLRWSFFNLVLVATLGLIMRLKVVFELPFINQKHLQLGHAQFAFQAWVSQLLLVLLLAAVAGQMRQEDLQRSHRLLVFHQALNLVILLAILAMGMSMTAFLLPFLIYSVQAALMWQLFQVYKQHAANASKWLAWAMLFAVVSWLASLGLGLTFGFGKMTVNTYLGWHYSHLHFQYNGWFWFAAIALVVQALEKENHRIQHENLIRRMMVVATVVALFLSLLWLKLPVWVEIVAGMAAVLQLFAWVLFARNVGRQLIKSTPLRAYRWLMLLVAIAISVKQLMQPALLHDTMAAWAYGFRPVIIAYLHLVLLGIFSLFVLFYSHAYHFKDLHPKKMLALKLFAMAVILNELVLAWQGVASIDYLLLPGMDWGLLATAALLATGALLIWLNSRVPASAP